MRSTGLAPPTGGNPATAECVSLALAAWSTRILRPILYGKVEEWKRQNNVVPASCQGDELDDILRGLGRLELLSNRKRPR
jgi:hypothetical protein